VLAGDMILSSGMLTPEERRAAFDAVPEMKHLMLNRSTAAVFANPVVLDQIDGMAGGFAREAFTANADATYLLVRAAGQVAESRAAELFCARAQPDGWLDSSDPLNDDEDKRLRRSLVTIPHEACANYIDSALNHAAFRLPGSLADGSISRVEANHRSKWARGAALAWAR
jgi:hypothetical protein